MKIGIICNEYPPAPGGGIGTTTQTLVKEFLRRKHDVVVLGYNLSPHSSPPTARYYPLTSPNLPFDIGKRLYLAYKAQKLTSAGEVDVWLGFDYQGYYLHTKFAPFVIVLEGSETFFLKELGYRKSISMYLFEYLCLHQATQWIAPSSYVLSSTKAVFNLQRPSVIIPNPVDTEMFKPIATINQSQNTVLFVGSVMRKKGVLEIAKAAGILLPKYPQLRFRFVGRIVKSFDQKVHAALCSMGGKSFLDRLDFVGSLPHEQIPYEISRAGCCVMPSYMETFGSAWAEAMACGKPVIGSLRGPGPEIIQHGKTGLLVDPESPEDIASKIELILNDTDLANRLGVQARRFACKRFNVTTVVDSYEELLGYYGIRSW